MIGLLPIPPVKPLAQQLIRVILSGYLLFALSATVFQLVMEFKNEKNNLRSQITSLVLTFQPSISEALWNYDDDQLNAALKGLYRNEEVVGVIVDGGKNRRYQVGLVEDEAGQRHFFGEQNRAKPQYAWQGIYDTLYVDRYDLFAPNAEAEHLGEMRLYSSSTTVVERTYSTFVLTLFSALIKTLALWLIATWVINRLVAKPLSALTTKITNFDIHSTDDQTMVGSQRMENELALLEKSFNSLCSALVEKNRQVKKHTWVLEHQIAERTEHLNQALEKMVDLNRAKSDFLANMSHELRTPLNSIIGFSKRLHQNSKGDLPKDAVDKLAIVLRNGEHLLGLINNVLDMSKIEAGKMEVKLEDCQIPREIQQLQQSLAPLAEDRQLQILTTIEPGLGLIKADTLKVRQIFNNLLGNAIKFSKSGNIDICVNRRTHNGIDGIAVAIADCGVGIAQEDLPRLFNQFEQLGKTGVNAVPGTGLGLALTHKLVALHRGTIDVASKAGEGSTFTVWLPK